MTVTYTAEVATVTGLGLFWKLLFRWRGSIYKLLWPDLIVYSTLYFSLSLIYRLVLTDHEDWKKAFENAAVYCRYYADLIPLTFVLGFYVDIVIQRWTQQFMGIPWPDALAMFVSTCIHGNDERGRLMRRTIMRYVNLAYVLTLKMMSTPLKKRFPTLEHLVEAGLMHDSEKIIFEDLNKQTSHPKYWMPLVWAASIVTRARKEGRIKDDYSTSNLIVELCKFRGQCGNLLNYDWISIPLVYTQVVTLAVYFYVVASVMGRQYLDPKSKIEKFESDLYVPIFPFLQFFFYMGWLKVAESLVNPFGEDDDDFEINWLVDRNLQVSYLIVDEMHNEHPELIKDQYWDEVFPSELPYTAAAEQYRTGPPQGSTAAVELTEKEAEVLPSVPSTILEEDSDLTSTHDSTLTMDKKNNMSQWLHRFKSKMRTSPLENVGSGLLRHLGSDRESPTLQSSKMRNMGVTKRWTTSPVEGTEDDATCVLSRDGSTRRQQMDRKRKYSTATPTSDSAKKDDLHPFFFREEKKDTDNAPMLGYPPSIPTVSGGADTVINMDATSDTIDEENSTEEGLNEDHATPNEERIVTSTNDTNLAGHPQSERPPEKDPKDVP